MSVSNYTLILNNNLRDRAKNYTEPTNRDLLTDLQANILKSHKKKYALHAFITFYEKKEEEVKKWLGNLKITSAWSQLDARYGKSKLPENIVNLYFTHDAYQYLNYDYKKMPESDAKSFSGTPQSRLALNINLEEEKFPLTNKIHAMLMLAGDDKKESPVDGKIAHAFLQWGKRKKVGPFGFIDDTSNPLFFPNPKNKVCEKEVARLDSVLIKDPNGANWNSCGSFLVFLKLKQNIKSFNKGVEKIKKATGSNTNMAKAFIVGKLPHRKGNGDLYLSKLRSCPMHISHIESAKAKYGELQTTQIARRGINYKDSKENQGLLFMSFQANISAQFEFLVNHFFANRKEAKIDPLLYDHSLEPLLSFNFPSIDSKDKDAAPPKLQLEEPFVTLQRGWYFFAPSISSVKSLQDTKVK